MTHRACDWALTQLTLQLRCAHEYPGAYMLYAHPSPTSFTPLAYLCMDACMYIIWMCLFVCVCTCAKQCIFTQAGSILAQLEAAKPILSALFSKYCSKTHLTKSGIPVRTGCLGLDQWFQFLKDAGLWGYQGLSPAAARTVFRTGSVVQVRFEIDAHAHYMIGTRTHAR